MYLELKKRVITSLILILILILMFINNIIYGFVSFALFALIFVEFSRMISIIFSKKKIFQLIINVIFIFYLSLFLSIFFLGINFFQLKIILFLILLICVASDIGGIIIGKIFKGPKLTKISPNKTISGSLGSFIFSILISVFLLNLTLNTEIIFNVTLGITVSLAVQLGDLFFSFLKRKSSLKNTGNILPGHGGVLDRVDGILLGIPCGLIFTLILSS
jgi:phosphatidate cytidylyltransferase